MESSSNTFSSLESTFKRLDPKDQSGIFFCLSLAAFIEHCIENDFVPIIEETVEEPCVGVERKKIVSELATAMVASCNFPNDKAFAQMFGCDPDMLRGITVMLVLADSDDPSRVREKSYYSRNRDEAKSQAVSALLRILGVSDKGMIRQLNGIEFSKRWNEFSEAFILGALTGMKGMPHPAMIAATVKRMGSLSHWSKAVLQEYIKIITVGVSKGHNAK
jgi:hypothetical protein